MKTIWIVLLTVLAVVFIGAGAYFSKEPGWLKHTYPDYYNQGHFENVALNSHNLWLKSLALTQLGTLTGNKAFDEGVAVKSRFKALQGAIAVLREAVISNPDNEVAKYNLELLINLESSLGMEQISISGGRLQSGQNYTQSNNDTGY